MWVSLLRKLTSQTSTLPSPELITGTSCGSIPTSPGDPRTTYALLAKFWHTTSGQTVGEHPREHSRHVVRAGDPPSYVRSAGPEVYRLGPAGRSAARIAPETEKLGLRLWHALRSSPSIAESARESLSEQEDIFNDPGKNAGGKQYQMTGANFP